MRNKKIAIILGFTVSTITALVAVIVLTGVLVTTAMPAQFRVTLGVVLALLAVYRFVLTFTQMKHRGEGSEEV